MRGLATTLTTVLLEALVEQHSERMLLGGTGNLTENSFDFPAVRPVLEALEDQVVMLRLLDQSVSSTEIVVRIGNETGHEALVGAALVSAG